MTICTIFFTVFYSVSKHTQLYTLKFSLFLFLFLFGNSLPRPLLSPTSPLWAHSRGLAHEAVLIQGTHGFFQKIWEESKSSKTSPFTKFFWSPRPNVFCPQQKVTSKKVLVEAEGLPSSCRSQTSYHSGLPFAYRFTNKNENQSFHIL